MYGHSTGYFQSSGQPCQVSVSPPPFKEGTRSKSGPAAWRTRNPESAGPRLGDEKPPRANVYPFLFYPTGSPGPPRDVVVTKSASELTLQWTEGQAGRAPTTGYIIEARPSGKGGGAPETGSPPSESAALRG